MQRRCLETVEEHWVMKLKLPEKEIWKLELEVVREKIMVKVVTEQLEL